MKQTDTDTLVEALRLLARDIHCEDGIATSVIREAADRIETLDKLVRESGEAKDRNGSVDYGSNAGIRCDTDNGPCACGAWH